MYTHAHARVWRLRACCTWFQLVQWGDMEMIWAPCVNPFCRFSDPRQNSQAHTSTNHKQTHPDHGRHQNRSLRFHIHSLHHHKMFTFTFLNSFMKEQQTWNINPETLNPVSCTRYSRLLHGNVQAYNQFYRFSSVSTQHFDLAVSSSCTMYK